MSESSAGLVVNLMANDVNRFDTGPLFIHYLWIGPLETLIAEMMVAVQRIRDYLLSEECSLPPRILLEPTRMTAKPKKKVTILEPPKNEIAIKFDAAYSRWIKSLGKNDVKDINLEADIYLLDDPLSAVDTQVAKHIFERCIKRYLADKTVVLVTHQLQFIKSVDQIVVMDKGKIVAEGGFKELQEKNLKIIQLMANNLQTVHEDDPRLNVTSTSVAQLSAMSLQRRRLSMVFKTSFLAKDLRYTLFLDVRPENPWQSRREPKID
ncbi:unnamed protein product [Diatraea saccharalis]|uniref:ABC transporter domain-containing protein n=1 Tax=Diatraea saccharalis TaxID=40085 RepID=A0A9N9N2J2_9NEOP|nr:unnamed protein product [Diatraea saccharalis]